MAAAHGKKRPSHPERFGAWRKERQSTACLCAVLCCAVLCCAVLCCAVLSDYGAWLFPRQVYCTH